jgi:transcription elongation GreA/GreB family factor
VAEVGGDQWHDNAAYESLVIDIRGIDRRLSEAHQALNNAILVEVPTSFDRVTIGTRVKIVRDGEEMMWEIVGFGESDPDNNMLAYNTPLASLIMGKRKGEVVTGTIAGRKTKIEILEITKGGENASGS